MTVEPGPDPAKELPTESPRPWGRADRNRLFIWVAIGFILPLPFVWAFHHWIQPAGSVFTIQSELPIKTIISFFVVLATWIVSRMERRPLDDYGIPPRRAFGKRFWEGSLWGFAALSALLLILHLSDHFQIDSVALSGGAVFRYALGWAVVFLAVSVSEELGFRGYWLFSFSRRIRFWPAALFTSVVRRSPLGQSRRKHSRHPASRCGRFAFMFHPPPHRQSLVRPRLPRSLGLGRNLLLRNSR